MLVAGQFGLQPEDKPWLVTPFPLPSVGSSSRTWLHSPGPGNPPPLAPSTPTRRPSRALFLWLTAQLCCVWIRPRIKQEVEIKQKLTHTRARTHIYRHAHKLPKPRQQHEWQPVEKEKKKKCTPPHVWTRTLTDTHSIYTHRGSNKVRLCLQHTNTGPGGTTGISFLCAHTYDLFTC